MPTEKPDTDGTKRADFESREAWIKHVVDSAPPLKPEQIDILRGILGYHRRGRA